MGVRIPRPPPIKSRSRGSWRDGIPTGQSVKLCQNCVRTLVEALSAVKWSRRPGRGASECDVVAVAIQPGHNGDATAAQTAADHPTRRIRDLRAEGPSECVGTSTPEGRLGYFRAQTGPLLSAGRGVLHGAKGLTERLRADFIDRACRPPMLAKAVHVGSNPNAARVPQDGEGARLDDAAVDSDPGR